MKPRRLLAGLSVIAALMPGLSAQVAAQDTPKPVIVMFGAATYEATEGGADAAVEVILSETPGRDVVVPVMYMALGDTSFSEFRRSVDTLTFLAADSGADLTKTILVTAVDDALDDDGESLQVSFGELPEGVTTSGQTTTEVELVDNDNLTPITVAFGAATYTAVEGGAAATIEVILSETPGREVEIRLRITTLGGLNSRFDFTLSPRGVTFAAGASGPGLTQTVVVTATDDSSDDDGEAVELFFADDLPDRVTASGQTTTLVFIEDDDGNALAAGAPMFAADAMIADQSYRQYIPLGAALCLPKVAAGAGVVYQLTPDLPDGLGFNERSVSPCDDIPLSPLISGTPNVAFPATRYTFTAINPSGETVSLTFTIEVLENEDPRPGFDFRGATIADQTYTRGEMTALTLPVAIGGVMPPAYTYELVPTLPAGLTFNANVIPPTITGTPTDVAARGHYFYDATDVTDDGTEDLTFTIEVLENFDFRGATIADQMYTRGEMITALTLPVAMGGVLPNTYKLVPTLPAGLTFNANIIPPTITGTPTVVAAQGSYTYDASDVMDDGTPELTFTIEVLENFDFRGATIADQMYTRGEMITALTLPVAMGGMLPHTYKLVPTLPAGLTFNANVIPPTITGTPTVVAAPGSYTYDASDVTDDGTPELTFTIEVLENFDFRGATIADQMYTRGEMITALTLPVAMGGMLPHTYKLVPTLPAGLTFNANIIPPTITGTPTVVAAQGSYTYDASDVTEDGTPELTFTIEVLENEDPPPVFDFRGATIADQMYTRGEMITALTLPVAMGGMLPHTYKLVPTLPAGLTFNANVIPPTITGTPTVVAAPGPYIYDASDVMDDGTPELTFTIEVLENFDFRGATIADQMYTRGEMITALTLPVAMGGVLPHTYKLVPTLPAGLTFNANIIPPTITGTPTVVAAPGSYTYDASDVMDDGTPELTFMLQVGLSGVVVPSITTSPIPVTTTIGGVTVMHSLTVAGNALIGAGSVEIKNLPLPTPPAGNSPAQTVVVTVGATTQEAPASRFSIGASVDDADRTIVDISITVNGETVTMLRGGQTATVCLPVSDALIAEAGSAGQDIVLLHYTTARDWYELPGSQFDEPAKEVCARTTTFSPFAVAFTRAVASAQAVADEAAKQLLAHFGRTVATQAVDAMSERFHNAARPVSRVTFGGRTLSLDSVQSTGGALPAPGLTGGLDSAWGDGGDTGTSHDGLWGSEDRTGPRSMSGRELLRGARFTLALGGGDDAMNAGADGGWAVWGQSTVNGFEGKPQAGQSVDGNVFTGYLGFDYVASHILTGLALSHSESEGDFSIGGRGEMDASLTSLYPYMRLKSGAGIEIWGLLGYGLGDLEIKDASRLIQTGLEMRMAALGGRWSLALASEFESALKADIHTVHMDTSDSSQDLAQTRSTMQRLRLAMEVQMNQKVLRDLNLTPSVELGARWDGGDGEKGAGVELGGGLVYANPRHGVNVQARGRVLLAHEQNGFEEWGASVSGQYKPGARGRGLTLSLTPVWGDASSKVDTLLWGAEAGALPGDGNSTQNASAMPDRVDLEFGYAVASGRLFTLGPQHMRVVFPSGVLTPYGSLRLDSASTNRVREGLRWAIPGFGAQLELFGEHTLNTGEQAEHRIGFTSSVQF